MALSARNTLSIRSSDPDHSIAVFNPLILAHFNRPAKVAELEIIRALAAQGLAEGITGGLLFVTATKNLARGIDPGARAIFERMVRENSAASGASAVVIQTDGFAGALLRSFLAGLGQLSSRRRRLQVCSSVDEACRWLAPHHGLVATELSKAHARATEHFAAK